MSQSGENQPVYGDNILSNSDVKSMNTALTEALLSLSNQTDQQAQATQQDIKSLKNIAYGVIASDKPSEFKDIKNIKSRLENASKYNQQFIDILSELEKSEHVDLSNEIKQVKEANNSINDNLKVLIN